MANSSYRCTLWSTLTFQRRSPRRITYVTAAPRRSEIKCFRAFLHCHPRSLLIDNVFQQFLFPLLCDNMFQKCEQRIPIVPQQLAYRRACRLSTLKENATENTDAQGAIRSRRSANNTQRLQSNVTRNGIAMVMLMCLSTRRCCCSQNAGYLVPNL
jgi:hypothetical protein